jgi:hypothetical protein
MWEVAAELTRQEGQLDTNQPLTPHTWAGLPVDNTFTIKIATLAFANLFEEHKQVPLSLYYR